MNKCLTASIPFIMHWVERVARVPSNKLREALWQNVNVFNENNRFCDVSRLFHISKCIIVVHLFERRRERDVVSYSKMNVATWLKNQTMKLEFLASMCGRSKY